MKSQKDGLDRFTPTISAPLLISTKVLLTVKKEVSFLNFIYHVYLELLVQF